MDRDLAQGCGVWTAWGEVLDKDGQGDRLAILQGG